MNNKGISRTILAVVVVVIVIILVGGAYALTRTSVSSLTTSSTSTRSSSLSSSASSSPSSSLSASSSSSSSSISSTAVSSPSSSSSSTQSAVSFGPANRSELVDDSFTVPSDSLDPATGVQPPDNAEFNNVFQMLVQFDGLNSSEGVVVPILALNYTVSNTSQTYMFNLRPNVTFSNGDQFNAYDVWFSYVRLLYMDGVNGPANFIYLTESLNQISLTGLSLPWGLLNAIQNVTGMPVTSNYTLAENVINNLLSNFNPNNNTQDSIMSYPDQAYVVTSSMIFTAHELQSYPYFLPDIAQIWCAIVDPAYVDAHGGVQANTPNAYFNSNGGPGTGPYEIQSIGAGFSDLVLKANPTYWALTSSNYPVIAQPPHIPVIIVNNGLTTTNRLEAFATNQAQISYVDFPFLGQLWNQYQYKQYTTFGAIYHTYGLGLGTYFMAMNTQKYPTNITDLRLAVVHAINYTQLLDSTFSYNGSVYGANIVGPMNPAWGPAYNPGNLPPYSYNTTLAISLLNQAGQEGGFSLTLPNGTLIGNTSAAALSPIEIVYQAPITPTYQTELTIIQSDLAQVGLPVSAQAAAGAVLNTFTTPASSPNFEFSAWGPDWPDPVLQQIYPLMTPIAYYTDWMNISSMNNLLPGLVYLSNQTARVQGIEEADNITYNYAPFLWLPTPDEYFLEQPYLLGFTYSLYTPTPGYYWYNMLYYANSTG